MRRRKSLRLRGYDYSSAGAYFVTACTFDRLPLFGVIEGDQVKLSRFGQLVPDGWQKAVARSRGAVPDEFIVMPDYFHAIAWLNSGNAIAGIHTVGTNDYPPLASRPTGLRTLMRGVKGATTAAINTVRNSPGHPVWQRGYYDRVIRNERELDAARQYVRFNVQKCLVMRETRTRR